MTPNNPGTGASGGQQQMRKDQRTAESDTWHRTAKVIELIGNSKESFEDAVQSALSDASRTVRHISGADVQRFSVKCEEGRVIEYRVDLKIAFGIERDGSDNMQTNVNR